MQKRKSITAAVHIKPADGLRFGLSYYNDEAAAGSKKHSGEILRWNVKQNLFTASTAYFGNKFEVLAEGTVGSNHTDTTKTKNTLASYIYAGLKLKEKWVPYLRLDNLQYQNGEIFFQYDNTTAVTAGLRYELNYLSVVKLEFQHSNSQISGNSNKVMAQFAIGF